MPENVIDLPLIGRAATLQSVNEDARTFEVVWTTGAQVRRYSWMRDEEFDEELAVDAAAVRLERLNSGAPFLESHNGYRLQSVLGVVVEGSARIENGRGVATIRLSDRDDVEPIWRDIKAGIIRNVSAGYRVHRFERIAKADRTDGGQRALYRAVDWEPLEVSAVAIGADPGAQIRSEDRVALSPCVVIRRADTAKEQTMSEKKDIEAPDSARQDPALKAPEPETKSPSTPDVTEAARAAVEAERKRSAEIRALCKRHGLGDEMAEDLIARGVDLPKVREAVLEKLAERQAALGPISERAPAQLRDGQRDAAYRDAVSAALMHRDNPGRNALPDDAREFRGLSLIELARTVLERHGVSTRGMSKMEVAGAAFATRAAASYHTTSDFPSILANVANKSLRAAYETTPRTFALWARRATITDFKPVQRTQLGGAPDLSKVLESGEFKYGTMGDAKEVYALATYGRIVAVTRQTLINDDLDAFTRIPAAFGAAAADLESDIVYSILIDNPTMGDGTALFHANHGNLATAAAVINEASLAAAYRSMGAQKGLDGRLVRVLPAYIITPPGVRSVEARKQIAATTPSSVGDVNPFAGRLQPIEEPRLIPGSGQDPWFLAADPSRIDTVEYAYLDGQEGVFTEVRTGFEVDGMEIKARHDFAAKAIDWRGLFKNAGAAPS